VRGQESADLGPKSASAGQESDATARIRPKSGWAGVPRRPREEGEGRRRRRSASREGRRSGSWDMGWRKASAERVTCATATRQFVVFL
jgi:hypothetical protein